MVLPSAEFKKKKKVKVLFVVFTFYNDSYSFKILQRPSNIAVNQATQKRSHNK